MNKTKLWFGLLILFFITVFLITPFWFNSLFKKNIAPIFYNQTEHHSCHINIGEPTIILRMDDVRAYSVQTPYLVDEVIKRNMSITLGIIPRDLEEDNKIIKYLRNIRDNPKIEIAQHGTYHDESDINITEESLLEGNIKIQKYLGVKPVTYIPPYNRIDESAREIISKYFRVISGKFGILKEGENIAEIGYTVETYDYSTNQISSIDKIISECKSSLEKTNLCVIMIHPQEYSSDLSNPIDLSNKKFDEFKEMLDKLQQLNATFSTFKDLVACYEEI